MRADVVGTVVAEYFPARTFADTNFFIAILDPRDRLNTRAVAVRQEIGSRVRLVTTRYVLAEVLAHFSESGSYYRERTSSLVGTILDNPGFEVLINSDGLFDDGLALYRGRSDKAYSLVDCISMQAMRAEGIAGVLTSDHHFEQEGFQVLL